MGKKIMTIIGILLIVLSASGLYIYNKEIINNSEFFGEKIVVLNKDIKAGDEITKNDIDYRKEKKNDLISKYLTEKDVNKILGNVAAIDLYKNEGITKDRIIKYDDYYPEDAQEIALNISSIGAISGNLKVGDVASLWDKTDNGAILMLENVRILAIRDSQNQNVDEIDGDTPAAIVVKLNKEQIEIAKNIKDLFVTKPTNQVGK